MNVLENLNQNKNVDVDVEFHVRILNAEHEERADKRDAQHSIPVKIEIRFCIPKLFVLFLGQADHFVAHSFLGR